jgi:hypothetical protein
MTQEPQRTLDGYKGKVQEPGEFSNPNEGKPLLNDNDEYILKLISFPRVISQKQPKEKKDGTKYLEDVEKAVCEFEEQNTKNIVVAFFRVDKLNFSDEDAFRSAIIKFFQKIGHPLPENVYPDWKQFFVVGMRFRSRVAVGMDRSPAGHKTPNGHYYLDVPTCRKLLPSDIDGSVSSTQGPAPKPSGTLANALLLAKGAVDLSDALFKLKNTNAPQELIKAFVEADVDNKITYPI